MKNHGLSHKGTSLIDKVADAYERPKAWIDDEDVWLDLIDVLDGNSGEDREEKS